MRQPIDVYVKNGRIGYALHEVSPGNGWRKLLTPPTAYDVAPLPQSPYLKEILAALRKQDFYVPSEHN